ncbi:hypothetical protein PPBDW_I20155 [Photobacterium kishitanii]|nr:hypothetical protein PPBDW_I20155 [Photobacterium kishitanii]
MHSIRLHVWSYLRLDVHNTPTSYKINNVICKDLVKIPTY